MNAPATPATPATLTTVEELLALPEGSVVDTGRQGIREKTYAPDEWDMVMLSGEVLAEGRGTVTLLKRG